jgi:hypothetical protein
MVGMMSGKVCANQMFTAYQNIALGMIFPHADLVKKN